jgi:hypothetical protein
MVVVAGVSAVTTLLFGWPGLLAVTLFGGGHHHHLHHSDSDWCC